MTGNQEEEMEFQSTLPLRGVTERHTGTLPDRQISIHTPLAGSDSRQRRR